MQRIRFGGSRVSSSSRMIATLPAYCESGTPWTTSLTPMSTLASSGRSASSCGSSSLMRSADVKPFTAGLPASSSSAIRSTSWFGQRSASATEVPMVYESPSAT